MIKTGVHQPEHATLTTGCDAARYTRLATCIMSRCDAMILPAVDRRLWSIANAFGGD